MQDGRLPANEAERNAVGGEDGGQAILTTRAWSQSQRFDQAWALVAATYQLEVTVMTNVVELATHKKRAKSSSGSSR
ncbi:MAG: hypothetical protein IT374_24930 [Polyangiaceae bacterium]|nr:hypothetical protein [Polyangiaceae bacterium]